tara:strand:- start:618 stop:1160 length:543 start_codon:yes stop_codon:yes gene_type:complete
MESNNQNVVTTFISRKAREGKALLLAQWLMTSESLAKTFDGYEGTIRHYDPSDRVMAVIFQFSNHQFLEHWEKSDLRKEHYQQLDCLVEEETVLKKTGLETWFQVEGVASNKTPSKFKMYLASLIGIYPILFILQSTLNPSLETLPLALRLLILCPIVGFLMTYLMMPLVAKSLKNWLYN